MKKFMMALALTTSVAAMAESVTVTVNVSDGKDVPLTSVGIKPAPKGASVQGSIKKLNFTNFAASGTFNFETSAEDASVQFSAVGNSKTVPCVAKQGDKDAKAFPLKDLKNVQLGIVEAEGSKDPKDFACEVME